MKDTDTLRELVARLVGDKPLPWTVWTSNSFRRVSCDSTRADGDVLSAYNQRSDGHPDLSMPEDRLKAWIELTNALPDLLDRLDAERARAIAAETRLADTEKVIGDMEWLAGQRNLELHYYSPVYGDDDDLAEEWRVELVSGPINDREWEIVGRGDTPLSAVHATRQFLNPEQS